MVRGLVEPEVTVVEQSYAALIIEDGGIFALGLPVVAGYTDIVVVVQPVEEVLELHV